MINSKRVLIQRLRVAVKLNSGLDARASCRDFPALILEFADSRLKCRFFLPKFTRRLSDGGTMYSGTFFKCACNRTVWRALSCRSDCKSRGLSSKYPFNFSQVNTSCLISFKRASRTAILVTAFQASWARYLSHERLV